MSTTIMKTETSYILQHSLLARELFIIVQPTHNITSQTEEFSRRVGLMSHIVSIIIMTNIAPKAY